MKNSYRIAADSGIILLLQFLGCFLSLEIPFLILIFLFSLLISYLHRKGWEGIPIIAIILLVFQNFAIGLGAHMGGNTSSDLSYMTQVATVFVLSNAIVILLCTRFKFFNIFVIYLGLLFILFVFSPFPFFSKMVYLRNYGLIGIIPIIGLVHLDFKKKSRFVFTLRYLLKLTAVVFVFGLFMYFLPYTAWKMIGINEVYIAKGDSTIVDGYNGRFYTNFVSGYSIYRMASFYYEPVNLGYFFVFGIILSILYLTVTKKLARKYLYLFVNIAGLILTFGKGAYILAIIIVGLSICYKVLLAKSIQATYKGQPRKTYWLRVRLTLFISLIVFIMIFAMLWIYYINIGGAASPHFWGIEATSKKIISNPLGYGLGSGGNFGPNGMDFSAGAETGLLSMIYQIGVPIFLFVFAICVTLFKNAINNKLIILYFVPFSILFVSLFQENTFTPQCLIPILFLSTIRINKCECKRPAINYDYLRRKENENITCWV